MSTTQRAIQIQAPKVAKLVTNAPIPRQRPDHIAVAVSHVALNPTDWKSIDTRGEPGLISGCDYSGVVEAVGANVASEGRFRVGDRVAGVAHGANASNSEDGAFAEHIMARAALATKVPPTLSMAEAATLGVGVTTVAQGLYQSLGLPWPGATEQNGGDQAAAAGIPVLIYGGSTATGTLAIQFAKLSGCTVLTTCSPRNFELVRRLGADHVFDYNAPGVGAAIRKAAGEDGLAHVFDCVSQPASAAICADAFGAAGGKYSALLYLDGEFPREDVEVETTMAYTAMGEEFRKGTKTTPARPQDLEFATRFWKVAGELLEQGKVKPHPPQVREGGLGGILDGLEDMRQGKVSGVKLVYKVQDV
ncbi:zinc-binding oxidoreductase [Diplodia corticola]|uniref:Zinc-binding oxidoreductase n=1 Tax=Diplodia corticola TaxID=236234 RepID=A0A1J9R900_9PEZI|nr:zinc-binding oxidoreductase [Diplodia corticola]OJD28899.1 zinc-binding oxidoreductase [Diplodia corticola]